MSRPILSVLIAAYQAEATIHRAIDSVLVQPDTEVVVAPDDGSQKYMGLEIEYPGRVTVLAPSYRTGPGPARPETVLSQHPPAHSSRCSIAMTTLQRTRSTRHSPWLDRAPEK